MKRHSTYGQNSRLNTSSSFLPRTMRGAVAAGLVAIVGLSLTGTIAASSDDNPRGCTLATLRGRYPFAFSGTSLPPAFGVTTPTASNAAGFHFFNGDGTGTDTVTFTVGGVIALDKAIVPISYTVNADCTGAYTVLVPNGPSFELFIAADGEQFAIIATGPSGNAVASVDHRVSRK